MSILKTIPPVLVVGFLAACVSEPAGNQINIDNDGGGKFSGHAGMEWSEEEISKMIGGQVCGGPAPKNFNIRVLSGSWLFSGSC